jgi:ribosomal protein S12 methylthiotransferase
VELPALLRALLDETDVEWIRLLYCFPDRFSDELIDLMAANPRITPYVDVPLQHVSRPVLRAMKRPGNAESFMALLERVRDRVPGVAVRTAFIVGFPGEGEDEFAELHDFVTRARFDRLFVFEFSREEGTPADLMEHQVAEELAAERRHALMATQARVSAEINRGLVGQEVVVLCESRSSGSVAVGRSGRDAPEVDQSISIVGTRAQPGEFVRARVTRAFEYDLVARGLGRPW